MKAMTIFAALLMSLALVVSSGCRQDRGVSVISVKTTASQAAIVYSAGGQHGIVVTLGSPTNRLRRSMLTLPKADGEVTTILTRSGSGHVLSVNGGNSININLGSMVVFRQNKDVRVERGMHLVADVQQADGSRVPIFMGVTDRLDEWE